MLDLVREEEQVAHLTGLGFEELLTALDGLVSSRLADRYAEVSDGYLRLAGRGRLDDRAEVAFDRLDSALRMLLGERGLLVLAGRLLHIKRAAIAGQLVFTQPRPGTRDLLLIQQSLARAARLADDGLRGPVPVDGPLVARHARRASAAAAALIHLRAGGGWLSGWINRPQVAEAGLSRLFADLVAAGGDQSAWEASENLFEPRCGAGELVRRLRISRQCSGWANCAALWQGTAGRIDDLAELVREGLGA